MNELAAADISLLRRLEATIQAGKNTFVAVGNALAEIREKRLYLKDHKTFDEYCEKKWGWGARRASQLINSAAVVQSLPSKLGTNVPSEGAARAVAKVEPERRAEVLSKVAATGQPITAKAITEAAKPEAQSGYKFQVRMTITEVQRDDEGYPLTTRVIPFFNRTSEIEELHSHISAVIRALKKAEEESDALFTEVNCTGLMMDLRKIRTQLDCAIPHSVCYLCQGHPQTQPKGQCSMCKGRGFISKHLLGTVPEELRKIRVKGMKK